MAQLRMPPKSRSRIYTDDRTEFVRTPYAITVRHDETIEILRFANEQQAMEQQRALLKQGYRLTRKPR